MGGGCGGPGGVCGHDGLWRTGAKEASISSRPSTVLAQHEDMRLGLGSVFLSAGPPTRQRSPRYSPHNQNIKSTGRVVSLRTHCCAQRHPSTGSPPFWFHHTRPTSRADSPARDTKWNPFAHLKSYLHLPVVKLIKLD